MTTIALRVSAVEPNSVDGPHEGPLWLWWGVQEVQDGQGPGQWRLPGDHQISGGCPALDRTTWGDGIAGAAGALAVRQ